MNAILKSKDTVTPKFKETCDNYQNHFISRVIYNSDRELYIIIENSRGTIDDKTANVIVCYNKDEFNFETDYVNTKLQIHEIKVAEFPLLEVKLDDFVNRILKAHDEQITLELNHFVKVCNQTFRSFKELYSHTQKWSYKDLFYAIFERYLYARKFVSKKSLGELIDGIVQEK